MKADCSYNVGKHASFIVGGCDVDYGWSGSGG